jgi:hypothetical protein
MTAQAGLPREILPAILAAGDIQGALAVADEWADVARSAGSSPDEFHARFSRVATFAYASRFQQVAVEQSALASEPKPSKLTISDQVMELSVLAEIRRGLGNAEAPLIWSTRPPSWPATRRPGRPALTISQPWVARARRSSVTSATGRLLWNGQREVVSAARELGLQMLLAGQLQVLASRLLDYDDAEEAAKALSYGSCRSLPWRLVGVGMPSLVGLLGSVLVAASP